MTTNNPTADSEDQPYGDYAPTPTTSDSEVRAREQYQERKREAVAPNFWESWSLSRKDNNVVPIIEDALSQDTEVDPDYRVTDEDWNEATKGIPVEAKDSINNVRSRQDLFQQADNLRNELSRARQLQDAGWTGVAASVGASIFNEENILLLGASLAGGAAATSTAAAQKASRIARIAQGAMRGGAAGAAENAAVQSFIASQKEAQGMDTVLHAAAFGGALGGAAGGLFGGMSRGLEPVEGDTARLYAQDDDVYTAASADLKTAIERAEFEEAQRFVDENVTPEGQSRYADQLDDLKAVERERRRVDNEIDETERVIGRMERQDPVDDLIRKQPKAKRAVRAADGVSRLSRALGRGVDDVSPDTERLYDALLPDSKGKLKKTEARRQRKQIDQRAEQARKAHGKQIETQRVKLADLKGRAAELSTRSEELGGQFLDGFGRQPGDLSQPKRTERQQSVNAAKNEGIAHSEDFYPQPRIPDHWGEETAPPAGKVRIDPYTRMVSQTESPTLRGYGRTVSPNPVGETRQSGRTTTVSASEIAAQTHIAETHRFLDRLLPARKAYMRAHGLDGRYEKNVSAFNKQVYRQIVRGDIEDPHVRQAAEASADVFERFLTSHKNLGRTGFRDIPVDRNYAPRDWMPNRFSYYNDHPSVGLGTVRQAIRAGIRQANDDDVSDALVDAMTEAIVKRKHMEAYDLDADFNRAIFSRDEGELKEVLGNAGVDERTIDDLIENLKANDDANESGTAGNARGRIRMDPFVEVEDLDGNPFNAAMLVEQDIEHLVSRYIRRESGVTGYLRAMRKEGIEGDIEPSVFHAKTLDQIRAERASDTNVRRADEQYKILMGMPIEDTTSAGNQTMRLLGDYHYATYMGQVGAAQLPEFGMITSELGLKTLLSTVPDLGRMFRKAQSGELTMDEAQEMLEIGIGPSDRLLNQPRGRGDADELEERSRLGISAQKWSTADRWMGKTSRFVGDYSGMNGINLGMNRMMGISISRKMYQLAKDPSKASRNRLRNMGLSDDMQDRVFAQIRRQIDKHGDQSAAGQRRFHFEDWDDMEARDAFVQSMFRWSAAIVQRNIPNELPRLFNTQVGRMLMKFRSFVFNAWGKQTLRNLGQGDITAANAMLTSTLLGAMTYVAQTYINSFGQEDPDEYRRERLSVDRIAAGAFQRTGMSSIIPTLADTAITHTGLADKPVFGYARGSGLATSWLSGVPVMATVDNASTAVSGATGAGLASVGYGDHRYSQKDFEATMSLLPFQNAWIFRNVAAHMGSGLPRDYVNDPRSLRENLGID